LDKNKQGNENGKNNKWLQIAKHYDFIQAAELSNSFIVLMALDESNQPQSSTQISEMISSKSSGKIFKVSGTIKDTLEKRLRKLGYVEGKDVPNIKGERKPIRMTLYSITPKGQKLLKGWIGFLSAITECKY
jgi:DNA-binding PadR family transcriptional regulator